MATEGKRRVVPDMIAFTAAMFIEGARNVVSLPLTVFQCLEWLPEHTEVLDSTLLF